MSRAARRRANREARQKAPKLTVSTADKHGAFHEACHAVASIRLGLPLASTDIIGRAFDPGTGDRMPAGVLSQGYTTLVKGTSQAWLDTLPDPDAREKLKRLAVQAAAGIVAEIMMGNDNDLAYADDERGVVGVAGVLGITDRDEVLAWMAERISEASKILAGEDKGAAVNVVAAELVERRSLTGDDVRALLESLAHASVASE